jgi:hypothetical protein
MTIRSGDAPGTSDALGLGSSGAPGPVPSGENGCATGLRRSDRRMFLHQDYRIRDGDRPGEISPGATPHLETRSSSAAPAGSRMDGGPWEMIWRSQFRGGGGTTGIIPPGEECVGLGNARLRFADASFGIEPYFVLGRYE